jgi:hypothetical protein
MSDATITRLTPRPLRAVEPRNCGAARVIEMPARRTGRVIEPLHVPAGTVLDSDVEYDREADHPGPLARALSAMAATGG